MKTGFAKTIRNGYELRAKSCATCETPGACCLDAHFVNVRITRLEAVAINWRLDDLSPAHSETVCSRIEDTIQNYGLADHEDAVLQTYACPLFEKGIGCLVHEYGKPLPCIVHACYGRKEDVPPDALLTEREIEVDRLNERVYGRATQRLPLPIAIKISSSR
ncbi:MAG TPA: hypothetical protein VJ781_00475 [Pyrinomonadaceae bacterium]|nr:hypothetical protein [Pyrinomonadaceae bacterium]